MKICGGTILTLHDSVLVVLCHPCIDFGKRCKYRTYLIILIVFSFYTAIATLDKRRLWFEDHRGQIQVFNNGIPFTSVGKETRECHHGPKRERKSGRIVS